MVCPHGQGGGRVELVRTRGRGQFFAILCGRPLCTAPNDQLWASPNRFFYYYYFNQSKSICAIFKPSETRKIYENLFWVMTEQLIFLVDSQNDQQQGHVTA